MAAATVKYKTVTTETLVPGSVILELTQDEAQIIFAYTAKASGTGPYRKDSDAIWKALRPHVKCDQDGHSAPVDCSVSIIHGA